MLKKNIQQIFEIFQSFNPNPQTELKFTNNFTLLVAVVLSAQSTDKAVNQATEKLFKIVDNPHKMLNLGENQLKKYISSIGLFNNKAKNIIALSKILIEKFNGQVPNDFD
jgi:endonuclease-3